MIQTQQSKDDDLKDAVVDELAWTPSVNSTHIGVTVDHGAVTLSGEVDTFPERLAAEKAVLRVHGVTTVAEEVTVHNRWTEATDTDIAREATEALERAVDVPMDSVQAVVHDRFITLSGPVMWQYQREAAERAVRYLKGVTGVVNDITIRPSARAVGLRDALSAAFVRNAQLEVKNITILTQGGAVTLEGSVHSPAERRSADIAAWSAPGVTGVVNHLQVVV